MIKVDKGAIAIEGHPDLILSELSFLVHHTMKQIEEKTGMPYERMVIDLDKGMKLYVLTDSGMTVREAMEVVGINTETFNEKQTIEINGADYDQR